LPWAASTSINIDSSNDTLAGIAAAINESTNNPGVTASVITTSAGARLVLSGTVTGAANAITVTESGGDGGLASLVYDPADTTRTSRRLRPRRTRTITINGYPATSANNVVSGAIRA
jgi:flagellar hook-associated protein 2